MSMRGQGQHSSLGFIVGAIACILLTFFEFAMLYMLARHPELMPPNKLMFLFLLIPAALMVVIAIFMLKSVSALMKKTTT